MPDIKHFDPDAALERIERLFWRQGAAVTSIQAVATATGLNRSSLYATFGGKRELYRAALRRYLTERAEPALRGLAEDGRGLPAIREFFAGLIDVRCSGEYAGWGCMVVNASSGTERGDSVVDELLEGHYRLLRDAFRSALEAAAGKGQLAAGCSAGDAAEVLAVLAYGVNVRSRAGADAATLHRAVSTALAPLERTTPPTSERATP